MGRPLNIDDHRRAARRRLPRAVFDYIDGGAETEQTVRGNLTAFEEVWLRPRGAQPAVAAELATTVLGQELALPLILGPCGGARLVHPGGDVAAARAAGASGTAFVLSAMSGHDVDQVVRSSAGPVWLQLYEFTGCEAIESLVERAASAGVAALVATIDTATNAIRERDLRNGVGQLLRPGDLLRSNDPRAVMPFLRLAAHPRWALARVSDGPIPALRNVRRADGSPARLDGTLLPRSLSWAALSRVRSCWRGPLIVKGVLTPDDARRAVELRADAIVVSNHGGRQLDGAEPTLRALADIAAAVDGECEVLIDGGIRRGGDVLKALALGASAALIARPWLYGLATGGEAGVHAVLELLRDSLARNLVLLGCQSVSDVGPEHVRVPPGWSITAQPSRARSSPPRIAT